MKKIYWIGLFLMVICIYFMKRGEPELNSELIEIEFDGAKDEFYKKYNLFLTVDTPTAVSDMMTIFNDSKEVFSCSTRPVLWQIYIYIKAEINKRLLFKISSSTNNKIRILKDYKCYENDLLVKTILELVQIDRIREHTSPLLQEDFNQIIKTR